MEIKARDEQRLILAPSFSSRLKWIFWLVVAVALGVFLPPRVLGITISVVLGFYCLRKLIGKTVVIDKPTRSITVEERNFLLIPNRRVIPFMDVTRVVVDYHPGDTNHRSWWDVYLDIGGKKFKIDSSTIEWSMWALGLKISELIGKEMIDKHGKDTSKYAPKVTRKEIVEKWKKRAEQEAEKKKRGH